MEREDRACRERGVAPRVATGPSVRPLRMVEVGCTDWYLYRNVMEGAGEAQPPTTAAKPGPKARVKRPGGEGGAGDDPAAPPLRG